MITAPRRARYSRAASDAKNAVYVAAEYVKDHGVYPTSITVLVEERYAALSDKDPWGNDYVLSPVLTESRRPQEGDNVYVYSRGAEGTGVYPDSEEGGDGSVGYSSVDGSWEELHHHTRGEKSSDE